MQAAFDPVPYLVVTVLAACALGGLLWSVRRDRQRKAKLSLLQNGNVEDYETFGIDGFRSRLIAAPSRYEGKTIGGQPTWGTTVELRNVKGVETKLTFLGIAVDATAGDIVDVVYGRWRLLDGTTNTLSLGIRRLGGDGIQLVDKNIDLCAAQPDLAVDVERYKRAVLRAASVLAVTPVR